MKINVRKIKKPLNLKINLLTNELKIIGVLLSCVDGLLNRDN